MFRAEIASALLFLVEVMSGLAIIAGVILITYSALQPDWDQGALIAGCCLAAAGLITAAGVQVGKAVVHIATTNDQILAAVIGETEDEGCGTGQPTKGDPQVKATAPLSRDH